MIEWDYAELLDHVKDCFTEDGLRQLVQEHVNCHKSITQQVRPLASDIRSVGKIKLTC